MRAAGYYWVKHMMRQEWEIMYWDGEFFTEIGYDYQYTEKSFALINERRIEPPKEH